MMPATIRPATAADTDALAALWHGAWHDGHADLVPPAILPLRTPAHFRLWRDNDPAPYWVADQGGVITGFVSTAEDELSRLFVSPAARGTGTAVALLRHGEAQIARSGVTQAHLLCTAGNERAARFYTREGWRVTETFDSPLWYPPGTAGDAAIPTWRMVKTLRP